MSFTIRDLTRDWRRTDAEKLARFFSTTWQAWPSGSEDPETPEQVTRRVREQSWLGVFVAEEEGAIRSFCSLAAKPNDPKGAHVALLTADPEYHGKGYGKAVLLAAVARVYELGLARVDLYTWPGNMKAVPLYKKSGFMWSPESGGGVFMQNFTPGARHHPIAQEFFRKHDWYRTIKRDLALTPDEHKRGKVRVYEYLWEEDGEKLRMVYDRQSWGLLEIETDDFFVACSLPDEKLIAGRPQRVTWKIVNHTQKPLEVLLIARGDEGVSLDHREVVTVARRAELSAEFEIDSEIKEKPRDPRAQIIHTEVLINGVPLHLEAGFQVKQAVSLSLDGDGVGLRRLRTEPLILQCRNEMEEPAKVKLHIVPFGLNVTGKKIEVVELPAKGAAEVTLDAIGYGGGNKEVSIKVKPEVRVGRKLVKTKEVELHAHVLSPGQVAGRVEEHRVVLESNALCVTIWRRGGWVGVTDKLRNRRVASMPAPQAGPPFAWEDFFQVPCEVRIEQEGDRVTAVLRTSSIYKPGLVLEQRITVSNLPLVEVRNQLFNGTGKTLDLTLRTGGWFDLRQGKLAALVNGEVVQGPARSAGRSLWEHRLSDEGKDWSEGWMAGEDHDGATAGLLWPMDELRQLPADRIEWGTLFHKLGKIEAGEKTSSLQRSYLYVGEGGYFAVQRWWQLLFGERKIREQRSREVRRPMTFGMEPNPIVLHGPAAKATLIASSVGRLELDVEVTAAPPKGIRITPSRAEFSGLSQEKPASIAARVTRSAQVAEGAYFVDCAARLDRALHHTRQSVIVLGDPRRKVTVTQEEALYRIGNGLLTLTIAPQFRGAAISLKRGEEELLYSAYPEARPYSWGNAWAGGIQPGLGGLSWEEMLKQRFTAKPIERRGAQGVPWAGVRVTCAPKEGPRREDRLSLDYLLAPGSAIMAVIIRLEHRSGLAGWLDAGLECFPRLSGSYLDAILTGSSDPQMQRIRSDHEGSTGPGRWTYAEHPKSGEAVLIACTDPEARVSDHVYGREGYCLNGWRGAVHEANETRESVYFLAYTNSDRVRDLAEALAVLKGLP